MTQSMIQYESDACLLLELSKLVDSLKEEIMSRLRTYEENELVTQSALLDQRFKKLAFSNTSERRLTNAMSLLRAKVCTISLPNTIVSTDVPVAQESPTSSQSLLWKSFDQEFDRHRAVQNPQAAGIIEMDKYLNEPPIGRHEDPLAWWNDRKSLYPRLFILARKRL